MSQDDDVRVSPYLIAQLNKLATYLTAQGEYEAVDLIDTVVARVTAMPSRELLAEALAFYALEDWTWCLSDSEDRFQSPLALDRGQRARAALKETTP